MSEETGNHLFVESCIPLHDCMYIIVSQDNATVTLLSNSHVSFLQLRAGTSLPGLVAAKVGVDVTLTDIAQNAEEIIQHLKHSCPAHLYATSMSPPAVQQVISAIKVILGEDGSNRGAQKLARIRENSNFFRSELKKMGFEVLGDNDSPVMPIMLYNPAKIPAFSRECLRQKVVVVTVVFPATPLLLARARICISASHTREHLIKALDFHDEEDFETEESTTDPDEGDGGNNDDGSHGDDGDDDDGSHRDGGGDDGAYGARSRAYGPRARAYGAGVAMALKI
uniref:serine C-palmitoyltransferase n=1 Tax=Zea mays TaxID=4577 RepID=A0A804N4K7_MAIZE